MSQSDPLTIIVAIYAVIAGLICLPLVRPPLAKWYRSGFWFIGGSGPVEILLKQVGYRLGFELFIFALSCVFGALGGWIFALYRFSRSKEKS